MIRGLIDITSIIIALISFIFSMIFFYSKTNMFFDSILAAAISAGFFWLGYIIIRMCYLVYKRGE